MSLKNETELEKLRLENVRLQNEKRLVKKNLSFVFKGQMTIEDLKGEISCLYIHLEN